MSKLTDIERQALDNACARLRETHAGTRIGNIEDFVDIDVLKTDASTLSAAINELFDKWANPLLNITIPPPGFFTLAGDSDGNLWCYCNDETNPPVFEHDEDTGELYLYIASEEGENGYKVHVGNYIAVKHLDNYYTKTEVDTALNGKADSGHNHDDRYYTETEVDTKLASKSDTTHDHDSRYYTESEVDAKLNGKANSSHSHDDLYYTESEIDTALAEKSDTTHTHDSRYYTESEIDTKVSTLNTAINGKADSSHSHDDQYYTESEVDTKLNGKANSNHNHDGSYYTESEIDTKISNINTSISSLQSSVDNLVGFSVEIVDTLPAKGEAGVMYLKLDTDNPVEGDVYDEYVYTGEVFEKIGSTATEVDLSGYATISALNTGLNSKADSSHSHDDQYYTESEVDTKLNGKANSSHSHDDQYYTETEVDSKLSGKSDTSHTHDGRYYTESEIDTKISSINTALNGKAASTHTHNDTDISVTTTNYGEGLTQDTFNGYLSYDVLQLKDNKASKDTATTTVAGLMSSTDKTKLDTITTDADKVTFSRSLSSGTKIGTLTINDTATDLYCNNDTNTTYSNATTSSSGLMSSTDKNRLDKLYTPTDVNVTWDTSKYNNQRTVFQRVGRIAMLQIYGSFYSITVNWAYIGTINTTAAIPESDLRFFAPILNASSPQGILISINTDGSIYARSTNGTISDGFCVNTITYICKGGE